MSSLEDLERVLCMPEDKDLVDAYQADTLRYAAKVMRGHLAGEDLSGAYFRSEDVYAAIALIDPDKEETAP